tara:strand:+ start:2194 stop:3714 length:1521 start_codon:yes stop_codon:yes gene_type:complete
MSGPPAYLLSRWVFLRLLGLIYLIAFASLATQVTGLVGADGILPAGPYLDRLRDTYGAQAYRLFPTLLWVSSNDLSLTGLCWLGAGLAALLVAGIAPVAVLVLLWVSYLSLTVVGQTFLGFQWDGLLLEIGLLACFYAPRRWWPTLATEDPPSPLARWLLWWLLFRLMFLSGITKLASGDPTWADWTALTYYYETQPLPLWTDWYAHQLPVWTHRLSAGGMYVIELLLPWAIFLPQRFRRTRLWACAGLVLLQVAIGITGNYGFFSMLSVVLCLTLVDDRGWRRLLPIPRVEPVRMSGSGERQPPSAAGLRRSVATAVATTLFALGGLTFAREIADTVERSGRPSLDLSWSDSVVGLAEPFRSVNGYGLFRVMTVERPEIVIEGSMDGSQWIDWNLRWKPGDPQRRPGLVTPHQPRLDWQLWFAALDPRGAGYWLSPLMMRLLEGAPAVTALVGDAAFADGPPRYLRLAYYDYRFKTPAERMETGTWWHRELVDYLTEPVSLADRR